MREAEVTGILLTKVKSCAVSIICQNTAASIRSGDHKEIDRLVQALMAVHMGRGIIGIPVFKGIAPLVQETRLIAQAVYRITGSQGFAYLHGPVLCHNSIGRMAFCMELCQLLNGNRIGVGSGAGVVTKQFFPIQAQTHIIFRLQGNLAPAQATGILFGSDFPELGADHIAGLVSSVGHSDHAGQRHGNAKSILRNVFFFRIDHNWPPTTAFHHSFGIRTSIRYARACSSLVQTT